VKTIRFIAVLLILVQVEIRGSVFDSVVVGAFQITFHAKIHVNDVFSFFKNYF